MQLRPFRQGTGRIQAKFWPHVCMVEIGLPERRTEMKLYSLLLATTIALSGVAFTAGCDDTISKKETTVKEDGQTVKRDKVEVKRTPEGDIKKEEVHERN